MVFNGTVLFAYSSAKSFASAILLNNLQYFIKHLTTWLRKISIKNLIIDLRQSSWINYYQTAITQFLVSDS